MTVRRLKRLCAAVMAAILLTGATGLVSPVGVAAEQSKADLEKKISELEAKQKQIKNKLADAKGDLSASQERKNLLDSQIENTEQQIGLLESRMSTINAQINTASSEITAAQTRITQKEAEITDTRDKLGQRLRAIMKSGNLSTLQMLMNTDNYTDYLLKSKVLHSVAQKDQQAIDELEAALVAIRAEKEELEGKKNVLADQKAEVQSLMTTANSKKKQLDTLCAAAQTEVRNMQSSIAGYNNQLQQTQKQIEAANNAITELIKKNASSGKSTGKLKSGLMFWPVPTVRAVSSTYGYRWGTMHRGIDVANGPIPIYGENIVAAADGTVLMANSTSYYGSGWCYGYGYCCIIDHGFDSKGRNVTTLYAHCSAMYATPGQKVVGGKTVIAKAGKSGNVTGPHLHFEVRLDGKSVDPLGTYVDPKYN